MGVIVIIYLIFAIICAFLGGAVSTEGKKGLGAFLGFLFGPLGILISAVACRG